MTPVDPRERRQLGVGKPRLRAAEALLARAVAQALEERRDRLRVAVSEWADRETVDEVCI